MSVATSFLNKVKLALRVNFTNFDSQITDLIEEAILDLTATADIKTFTTSEADAMQTGAVIAYVQYKWFSDDKYLTIYNDMKTKMALSGAYRSVMPDEE